MAETENAAGKTTPPVEAVNGKTRENQFHCIWEKDTRTIEAVKLASIDRRFDRLAGAKFERIAYNGMHCDLPWIRVTYEGAVHEAPLNAVEFIRLASSEGE
ncbi:hypothetical protein CHH26_11355 [Qipengyuania flava]|uniref:hypothetical protein n=1 Tax=Qipengyuania flava TaxID=192812 RepID=UPI000B8C11E5|nr:hypothetical protein [Qipengyuania flava]ASP30756.1 hypothetical protein CHH26_11355 [Qipengyuania flava]